MYNQQLRHPGRYSPLWRCRDCCKQPGLSSRVLWLACSRQWRRPRPSSAVWLGRGYNKGVIFWIELNRASEIRDCSIQVPFLPFFDPAINQDPQQTRYQQATLMMLTAGGGGLQSAALWSVRCCR